MRRLIGLWLAWFVLIAGVNLASPLYHVYAGRFSFSPLVLTAIFSTYAVVLVPALVLFGRLSDRFGRRPVLASGLGTGCIGLILFAFAQGEAYLYTARAVQGLAVAMVSGPATAALVELDPDGSRRRAALGAGLAQTAGGAVGPIFAGVLAEFAPYPLRLSYLLVLLLTAAAAIVVLRLPERGGRAPEPWRPQWPRVPAEIRRPFRRVALTGGVGWAAVSLYLSIVPSYAASLLGMHALALLAAFATTALLASAAAQGIAARREGSWRRDQAFGCVLLAVGLSGLIVAAPSGSFAVLLTGALVAGAGQGLAFLTAQEELNELAPDERRGEVTAAFIAVTYACVAGFVIACGLLALIMSLQSAVEAVSAVLIALALGVAAWHSATPRAAAPRRRAAAPRSAAARR
ncbi:MAG TPA: MFS transporter [Gaiellaceae bacterium]|nr:MFS transporter [Gaiellaceae bacterium]